MSILIKAIVGGATLLIGIAVIAHKLISTSSSEKETINPVDFEQVSSEDDSKGTKLNQPSVSVAEPKPSSIDDTISVKVKGDLAAFDPNSKGAPESKEIEFKVPEGKSRSDYLVGKQGNRRGICLTELSKCEWSDFLKTYVPIGQKDNLEISAKQHATQKCKEIKGKLEISGENYSCTYIDPKTQDSETADLNKLNLDNLSMYM